MKIGQHKANGTSLVALVFTGISGALTYALNSSVDITASILLASTAKFTARAGALPTRFPNGNSRGPSVRF
ncbi:MAG: hypothetical protein A4E55_00892 [Pelotomaculum sp. PtaU1.Bin035]|nr:MAG: hypothetical protein A4E55_00892 [Pelotomaculum sp. PtaU1.Bin035]